jgi:hypothetical protein
MIFINHSSQTKPDSADITSLKSGILNLEKEIIELSKRPVYNEKKIRNKKTVLKTYRWLVNLHERKEVNRA